MNYLAAFFCLLAACILAAPQALAGNTDRTGEFTTSFEEVAGYARLNVLGRRLFDSMQQQSLEEGVAADEIDPTSFTVDPRKEEWRVFVPESVSSDQPTGLLIWYAEDTDEGFSEVLVEAAMASNLAIIAPIVQLNRDDPFLKSSAMGLHGLNWFVRHYPVDQSRLLVGGYKDGAKIAQALLAGYPDVFTGAVLTEGGVAPGTPPVFVHGEDLLRVLRNNGRIVLLFTNEEQESQSAKVSAGYVRLCVNDVETIPADTIDADTMKLAFSTAFDAAVGEPDATCLEKLQTQMAADLAAIDAALENNKGAEGLKLLQKFHADYDALALAKTLERLEIIQEDYRQILREAGDFIQYRNNLQVPPPPPPQNTLIPGGGGGSGSG